MRTKKIDDQILNILLNTKYTTLLRTNTIIDNLNVWKPAKSTAEECQKLNSIPSPVNFCVSIKQALEFPDEFGVGGYVYIPDDLSALLDEIM